MKNIILPYLIDPLVNCFHLSLSKENLHFLWRFLGKLKQCPDADILHVEVTPYDSIQEQILTPSDLSVFCYIV